MSLPLPYAYCEGSKCRFLAVVAPRFRRIAAHNDGGLMRDIFTEIYENQPLDPMVSARQGARASLRKRFYQRASVAETAGEGGYAILLDGKPVKTPQRRALAAPVRELAEAIAREWDAQEKVIEPARMPLTRLANAAIDAVADHAGAVADEVAKYLGSDLLCYRADAPPGLVARQAQHWDPVIALAHEKLGARFVLIEGIVYAAQPEETIAAARAAIPQDIWRLAAVASITTLTGSALLALALAQGAIERDAAWAAAHVDEDFQMESWGRDDMALDRRAFRHADFEAAAQVLHLIGR
jgi:chaperone required for assembly of F1-ATPase